jgi:hypothetical protein
MPVASSSAVLGFRSFDLDALSEQGSSDPLPEPGQPVHLLARREAASARTPYPGRMTLAGSDAKR